LEFLNIFKLLFSISAAIVDNVDGKSSMNFQKEEKGKDIT